LPSKKANGKGVFGVAKSVKKNGKNWYISVNYNDMEGLLTTLGVMSALVLSFLVGLFPAIPTEDFIQGDYHSRLQNGGEVFRSNIIGVLQDASFNFSLWTTRGIDVMEILTDAPMTPDINVGSQWASKISAAFHVTKDVEGVLEFSSAIAAVNGEGNRSALIIYQSGISILLTTVALLGSISLYIALCLSDAREEEGEEEEEDVKKPKMGALSRFNVVALPATGVLYFIQAWGIIWFFIALGNTIALYCTDFSQFLYWSVSFMYSTMIPSIIVVFAVSVYCWWVALPVNAKKETPDAGVETHTDNNKIIPEIPREC